MIKKILISVLIMILLTSCGKKGDPIFNENNLNSKFNNSGISIFS